MRLSDYLTIGLVVINIFQGLILYSFRATLKITALELFAKCGDKFATKEELASVRSEIDLAGRVDSGFADVKRMIARPRRTDLQGSGG
jgi:hypothetical protein